MQIGIFRGGTPDSQRYPWNLYLTINMEYICFCGREPTTENNRNYKHQYLIHTWSDKAFKGRVPIVNRALSSLNDSSLKITFTVREVDFSNCAMSFGIGRNLDIHAIFRKDEFLKIQNCYAETGFCEFKSKKIH